jgi:putative transposase
VLGVILKQFTARDVISRWDVCEVHQRATATAATMFLDTLLARMPFPVRALQVDGGSEFAAGFEQACQQRQLRLFAYCHPGRRNSTALWNAPSVPTPRNSMR